MRSFLRFALESNRVIFEMNVSRETSIRYRINLNSIDSFADRSMMNGGLCR